MLTRSIRRLALWMSVYLLAAATGSVVMAEAPVRDDEGKVEAIEIYRAPDNKPVNGGTLIGVIAGGVIGHQIGSGGSTELDNGTVPNETGFTRQTRGAKGRFGRVHFNQGATWT